MTFQTPGGGGLCPLAKRTHGCCPWVLGHLTALSSYGTCVLHTARISTRSKSWVPFLKRTQIVFFVQRSCHVHQFTLSISLPNSKFTIFTQLSRIAMFTVLEKTNKMWFVSCFPQFRIPEHRFASLLFPIHLKDKQQHVRTRVCFLTPPMHWQVLQGLHGDQCQSVQ